MNENILKYRQKHKKCRYCKYLGFDSHGEQIGVPGFYVCKVKDKIIKDMFPDMVNAPRLFCRYYEVEGED